jgi:Kef-type K+ transport system membrane component KefB
MTISTLLLQIVIVLVAARAVGGLFRRFHQPQVIGEMLAGILLGPSVFGGLFPSASIAIFPLKGLDGLNALSQIGLLVFMFLVGLEFDPQLLRGRGHVAVVTSHVSIIVPFCLGAGLAAYLYPYLSPTSVPLFHFVLFMGIAMSITAFPVLARILTEGNLLGTQVGAVALACAAVDDVTAWCLLALVVFLVSASNTALPFWLTLIGTLIYIVVLLFGVRRYAHYFVDLYRRRGAITQDILALVLILMLISGWITETLGIHALFGAFLFGAILPRDRDFVQAFIAKLEDLTVVLLLPLFFAFTGLRTNIGLLGDGTHWLYCIAIILVAILGKLGGATLASRTFGMSWREATAIGMLMNTRGLIELVALNIGLDIGVLSPTVFTMMVLMALVTTFMTTPLLNRIYPAAMRRSSQAQGVYTPPADPAATPIATKP